MNLGNRSVLIMTSRYPIPLLTDETTEAEQSQAGQRILDEIWSSSSDQGGGLLVVLVIV